MTEAPCYLKVRGDDDAGLIRAFYAMSDESFEMEVATLSMQVATEDKDPSRSGK